MRFPRSSGVLLHPTSLPGRFGIGDLGAEAYAFIDFLAAGDQSLWQILPLGPPGYGNSPYQSFSAFAGNTLLVSPQELVKDHLLSEADLETPAELASERVDFGPVMEFKARLLRKAFDNFEGGANEGLRDDYKNFHGYAALWLEDYALFAALKDEHNGASWNTWERPLARRDRKAVAAAREELADKIEAHKFCQYLFFRQWLKLRAHSRERNVKIVGDIPIFVAHNSADVWVHPELFKLDEEGSPTVVSGVPPDVFSKTGQRWGNPLYDWERMRETGFQWWIDRLQATLGLVDLTRIDHFRGFAASWEVPAEDETAENGKWVEVPGKELFSAVQRALNNPPIIAEDLGTITPDVHELRDEFDFPGMRVLQFAFGGDPRDSHLPHNYVPNLVVYTGTHDNDTVVGWFNTRPQEETAEEGERLERERKYCLAYLKSDGREINWDFIRAALASVADIAMIPLQDLLGLDASARMNIPASEKDNWNWRYRDGSLTDELRDRLKEMTRLYGRAPDQ